STRADMAFRVEEAAWEAAASTGQNHGKKTLKAEFSERDELSLAGLAASICWSKLVMMPARVLHHLDLSKRKRIEAAAQLPLVRDCCSRNWSPTRRPRGRGYGTVHGAPRPTRGRHRERPARNHRVARAHRRGGAIGARREGRADDVISQRSLLG